ncbi:MAG: DUF459 domain-containing protein [Acidimicrobiia bacterium]
MTTTTTPEGSDLRTRSERRHADPERRAMSVGHVWMVGITCLLIGALLNAPGIRKTALSEPVGTERDVATALADPLYDVSHELYLDRLRVGLQELIGKGGEDDVDLSLPSPTIKKEPEEPKVPKKRAFTPTEQVRLWVGGDSLSITPGESVINKAVATQVIGILQTVDGHVATGLARPEVFNWPAYLQSVVTNSAPDAMVLTIGSNDDQTMTGIGGVGPFGSAEWQAEYRRRVGGLMDQVTGTGKVTLFWVGIPQMRNVTRYETRYKLINEIVLSEAQLRPGKVYFVETAALLAGRDGGYADFRPKLDGTVTKLRAGDGIHFERAGADLIADSVIAAMHEEYDLTSWQTAATITTAPPTTTTKPKKPKQGS